MYGYYMRQRLLDRQRRARLRQKLQKIGLVELYDDVIREVRTWNGRFRLVQRLRAEEYERWQQLNGSSGR